MVSMENAVEQFNPVGEVSAQSEHWSQVLERATVGTSEWDQAYASERDCIIRLGRAAFGAGLSRSRLTFGVNAREHCLRGAKSGAESGRRWSYIVEQVSCHRSVSERILKDALALAELSCGDAESCVPSLGMLDWSIAEMFKRFIKFSWDDEKVELFEVQQAEKLAHDIADGGYRKKNGGYDKAKIRETIDGILGTSRKKAEPEGETEGDEDSDQTEAVTSMEAVLAYLEAASPELLMDMCSKLSERVRMELADACTQE